MARWKILIPALYFLGGILVWLDFLRSPPDGLANIGLALFVFPVTLLTRIAGMPFPPFVPKALPYYQAHTAFFLPSLGLLSVALYGLCARLTRHR